VGQGTLLFDVSSGSGSAATPAFNQDGFQDYVVPANTNTGFSTSILKNPQSNFYANDNVPRYAAKTLWIKNIILIQDRTQWLTSYTTGLPEPTYQVIWHENWPAAKGYIVGSPNLVTGLSGNRLDLCRYGDAFGVGGVIRRVEWIVEPQYQSTGTATKYLDGASTGTITFSNGSIGWNSTPKYNLINAETSNETRDIHDFRIENGLTNTNISVTGVVVYYETTGLGIDVFGGSAFVNSQLVTTTSSTLALPANTSFRGGRTNIYETAAGSFGATTQFITDVATVATGSTNTNLLSCSVGTGQSYPVGTAVWIPSGTTQYIGNVLNQSTDTLTMGVTLPFGVSNTLYQLFQAGSTAFPIGNSLYAVDWVWDATQAFAQGFSLNSTPGISIGSGIGGTFPTYYFNGPYSNYRIWGGTMQITSAASLTLVNPIQNTGATYGLDLISTTSFLQVDGFFQALEFEFYAGYSALLHATISIDGMAMYNYNDAISGTSAMGFFRKSMFTNAGPGWHSVNLSVASGWTNIMITKIIGYQSKCPVGPSFGNLGQLYLGQTFIPQQAINASLMSFGNIRRVYADSLNFFSAAGTTLWIRCVQNIPTAAPGGTITVTSAAGGVRYVGATTACQMNFNYYGTAFALVGVAGGSYSMVMDGLGGSALFNTWLGTGNSLTFHTVALTQLGPTLGIDAVDFLRPAGEMKFLQNLGPVPTTSQLEVQIPPMAAYPQLAIACGGITSREIAPQAIQGQNLGYNQISSIHVGYQALTRYNMAPANAVLSPSCGSATTSSSSATAINNLGASIMTIGRPVVVLCQSDGSTLSNSNIAITSNAANALGNLYLFRDGSSIANWQLQLQLGGGASLQSTQFPLSVLSFIDFNCPAGIHTYQGFFSVTTGSQIGMYYARLAIMEVD
jgi:hypothetical protein